MQHCCLQLRVLKNWCRDFIGAGERFKDHTHPLRGDNDLLCITRPHVIKEIHMVRASPNNK
jgi:methionine synthase I (cobalamin-dependent)